jgi:hypothetical protein
MRPPTSWRSKAAGTVGQPCCTHTTHGTVGGALVGAPAAFCTTWFYSPTGCGVAAHRRLAGADDLYTALAAIWQPAPAGCGVVAHRRLAGVDDDDCNASGTVSWPS